MSQTAYSRTAWSTKRDVLITGIRKYLNFGFISGALGYGFRDNNGTIQVKHSGAEWADIATGTAAATWNYYVTTWSVEPTSLGTITGGEVFSYTLDGTTRYRFVPDPYDATTDAFYTTFDSGILTGLIVARG